MTTKFVTLLNDNGNNSIIKEFTSLKCAFISYKELNVNDLEDGQEYELCKYDEYNNALDWSNEELASIGNKLNTWVTKAKLYNSEMTELENIKYFFTENEVVKSAVSITKITELAKIPQNSLYRFINDYSGRSLTNEQIKKLIPVIEKIGYIKIEKK